MYRPRSLIAVEPYAEPRTNALSPVLLGCCRDAVSVAWHIYRASFVSDSSYSSRGSRNGLTLYRPGISERSPAWTVTSSPVSPIVLALIVTGILALTLSDEYTQGMRSLGSLVLNWRVW